MLPCLEICGPLFGGFTWKCLLICGRDRDQQLRRDGFMFEENILWECNQPKLTEAIKLICPAVEQRSFM